jgi:hypothetical protein
MRTYKCRIALLALLSLGALLAFSGANPKPAKAFYNAPNPVAKVTCYFAGGCGRNLGGGPSTWSQGAYSGSSNAPGTGVADWIAKNALTAGGGDAGAAAIEAEAAGALTGVEVGAGILAAPISIPALGGTALVIVGIALAKHYHVGSVLHSIYTGYTSRNDFVDLNPHSTITVQAWTANIASTYDGRFPSIGANVPRITRSDGTTTAIIYKGLTAGMAGCFGIPAGFPTVSDIEAFNKMDSMASTKVPITGTLTGCAGVTAELSYFTPEQYNAEFSTTAAPWANQAVDGTQAWPNHATGAGLTPQANSAPVPPATALSSSDPAPAYCLQDSGGVLSCGHSVLTDVHDPSSVLPGINNIGPEGQKWLACQAAPAAYTCPTISGGVFSGTSGGVATQSYVVPACVGLSIAECEAVLNQASIGANWAAPAFTIITAAVLAANPAYAPGAVLSTSPLGGATVSTDTDFTITTNPSTLPLIIPSPQPYETGTEYQTRLAGQGIPYTTNVLTTVATPVTIGPNEVASTVPKPGTLIDPTVTTVTINVGNPAAPYPNNDPNGPGVVTGPGGCNCGQIVFPVVALGSAFPFGIFTWLNGIYSGFTGAASCPTVIVHKPSVLGGGDQNLVLCSTDWETTYRPIVFPILEFLMTLAALWFVAFKVVGLGGRD